jgi:hypothetical protein
VATIVVVPRAATDVGVMFIATAAGRPATKVTRADAGTPPIKATTFALPTVVGALKNTCATPLVFVVAVELDKVPAAVVKVTG